MGDIRPFRPGDAAAMADICLRTADNGADATGLLDDDDLWAQVFVTPYLVRHPEFAFAAVIDGEVVGYVVGTPDTRAFEEWFRTRWWPRFAERWPRPDEEASRQDGVVRYAYGRGPGAEPYGDAYAAHLHIDLLPQAQGRGLGRRLIATFIDTLRAADVRGLHLAASSENTSAHAFYDRLGFVRLASHPGVQAFGMHL